MKVRALVTAILCAALAAPVIAQTALFPDVPEDHPRVDAIRYVQSEGIYRGFPDGSFRPDEYLTRVQFVKTAERLYDRFDSWTRADWAQVIYEGMPSLGAPVTTAATPVIAEPATTTHPPRQPPNTAPPTTRLPVIAPTLTAPPRTAVPTLPPVPGFAETYPDQNIFWTDSYLSDHPDRNLPHIWYLRGVLIDGNPVSWSIAGDRDDQRGIRIFPSTALHPGDYELAMELAPGGSDGVTKTVKSGWTVPLKSWRPRVSAAMETSFGNDGGWGNPGKWHVGFSVVNPVEAEYEIQVSFYVCAFVGTGNETCRWQPYELGRNHASSTGFTSSFRPGPVTCRWADPPAGGSNSCVVEESGDWPEYGQSRRRALPD